MKKNSITKNYIYNLMYQILAIIVPLITTPYVSRVLGPNGVGMYSFSLSIATYFTLFGTLGFDNYGQLNIAKNQDNREEYSILFWQIAVSKFISIMIWIVLYTVFMYFSGNFNILTIILIVHLFAASIDITWFFQGLEMFKITVFRNFIIKLISTILIFIFVKNEGHLFLYVMIVEGAILIGNLSLISYLKQLLVDVKIIDINILKHMRKSMIYFIPTLATSVYTLLDKSMLGFISNSTIENGYYEQANKIQQILVTVITSLAMVTMPRIRYLSSQNNLDEVRYIFKKTINFIILISLPMCLGCIVTAPVLIPWFLGSEYQKCIILLQIFSFLFVIVGLDFTIGKQCLMGSGRQKQYNFGVIIGAIVNFILNLILIPKYLSIGATISSIIAEFCILSIFIYFSKDLIDVKSMLNTTLKYFIAAIIMSIVVALCLNIVVLSTTLKLIISVVIGIIAYFSFLFIIKDEFVLEYYNILKDKLT